MSSRGATEPKKIGKSLVMRYLMVSRWRPGLGFLSRNFRCCSIFFRVGFSFHSQWRCSEPTHRRSSSLPKICGKI